jgi:hypothetical protein
MYLNSFSKIKSYIIMLLFKVISNNSRSFHSRLKCETLTHGASNNATFYQFIVNILKSYKKMMCDFRISDILCFTFASSVLFSF